ncbi:uncharacterized protein N7511_006639 [Penicillium nucicola]|uniref:uncharacterized protein n=1 Tax=Penicillium nucicola TaxID=1850975 RepID=UPI002545BCD9|nr:uncharacterized protein N7511_006639 [Penicillium nucicola]KAJ5757945.1 hypothetical protein N7511_006639 [Penicillium nucicola]
MKRACSPESSRASSQEYEPAQTYRNERPVLASLTVSVSPPPKRSPSRKIQDESITLSFNAPKSKATPSLAAIEAGQVQVKDHLKIISTKLSQCICPIPKQSFPQLPIADWADLYRRNERPDGRHFVIHQHDHPVAGPHYDLRLQISETSSVSWAIMYGMPGDPNSTRLNRNATETRIHCLWNHLIETASHRTGSMIIWDTGEYEVLPYPMEEPSGPETDDSRSELSDGGSVPASVPLEEQKSDSAKLQEAFQNGKIRLRLHGTRLPKDYTISLRMDKSTNYRRPIRQGSKRRRRHQSTQTVPPAPSTSDSEAASPPPPDANRPGSSPASASRTRTSPNRVGTPRSKSDPETRNNGNHSDHTPDLDIQLQNAYPGSTNSIGSIHQRRWYLSLDRVSSGFRIIKSVDRDSSSRQPKAKVWGRSSDGGFEAFHVHGPEVERSVVTGRLGVQVLEAEGVKGFVARRGWRPVLH